MNNKISKSIILILKGILLWLTVINIIISCMVILDKIFDSIYTILYLIIISLSCYLCYKIISIDEFEKITFCKYFDIDLKDE